MRLPKKLAKKVKRIFSGESTPSFYKQIIDAIIDEMKEESREGPNGIYVPNFYRILVPINKSEILNIELKDNIKVTIKDWINENDFKIRGKLEIKFVLTEDLNTGLTVEGEFTINPSDIEQTKNGGTKIFKASEKKFNDTCEVDSTLEIKPNFLKKAYLRLLENNEEIRVFKINSVETNIGRQETNEIVLSDPNVSRVHAQIIKKKYYYIIRDLDSTNGVIVNGELVTKKILFDQDRIRLGGIELEFSLKR